MFLLKELFRKKYTKIYLIIFSVLLVSVITILSFIDYYRQSVNDVFKKTSYIVVSSKNDYYNEIIKYRNVTNVEKAILFGPNYTYDVLGRDGYVSQTSNGTKVGSRESEENIRINWEDFFIDGTISLDDSILVFPSGKLSGNQISLGLASEVKQRKNYFYKDISDIISELIGQKIGFYINSNNYEFIIDSFYESYFSEMTISEELFDNISQKSNSYVYKLKVNDYKEAVSISEKIQKLGENVVVSLNEKQSQSASGLEMENLKELINILTFMCYIVIFIFTIVFIIVTRNIIRYDYKNIRIERLEYNKMHIKKHLILNEVILNTLVTFITILISHILNNILNLLLDVTLNLFNYNLLLVSYLIIITFTLIFCSFYSVNPRSDLQNNN